MTVVAGSVAGPGREPAGCLPREPGAGSGASGRLQRPGSGRRRSPYDARVLRIRGSQMAAGTRCCLAHCQGQWTSDMAMGRQERALRSCLLMALCLSLSTDVIIP